MLGTVGQGLNVLVGDTLEIEDLQGFGLAILEQRPESVEADLLSARTARMERSKGDPLEIFQASHHAAKDSVADSMLSTEALDIGACSSDGAYNLGFNKATVPVAVVEQVLEVATIPDDAKDELCHLEVDSVALDLEVLDRFIAVFQQGLQVAREFVV